MKSEIAGWLLILAGLTMFGGFITLIWLQEATDKELFRTWKLKNHKQIVRPVMPNCED